MCFIEKIKKRLTVKMKTFLFLIITCLNIFFITTPSVSEANDCNLIFLKSNITGELAKLVRGCRLAVPLKTSILIGAGIENWDSLSNTPSSNDIFKVLNSNSFKNAISNIKVITNKSFFKQLAEIVWILKSDEYNQELFILSKKVLKRTREIWGPNSSLYMKWLMICSQYASLIPGGNNFLYITEGLDLKGFQHSRFFKLQRNNHYFQTHAVTDFFQSARDLYDTEKRNYDLKKASNGWRNKSTRDQYLDISIFCKAGIDLETATTLIGLNTRQNPNYIFEACLANFDIFLQEDPFTAIDALQKILELDQVPDKYAIPFFDRFFEHDNVTFYHKIAILYRLAETSLTVENTEFRNLFEMHHDLIEKFMELGVDFENISFSNNKIFDPYEIMAGVFKTALNKKNSSSKEDYKDLLNTINQTLMKSKNGTAVIDPFISGTKEKRNRNFHAYSLAYKFLKKEINNDFSFDFYGEELFRLQNQFKLDRSSRVIATRDFLRIKNYQFETNISPLIAQRDGVADLLSIPDNSIIKQSNLRKEYVKLAQQITKMTRQREMITVDFLTVSNIQNSLHNTDIYLDYAYDPSSNSIYTIKITQNHINFFQIPLAHQIRQSAQKHKENISKNRYAESIVPGYFVYSKLIKPFLTKDAARILISPHAFLYEIPFSALPTSMTDQFQSEQIIEKPKSAINGNSTRGLGKIDNGKSDQISMDWLGLKYELALINPMQRYWKRSKKKPHTDLAPNSPFDSFLNFIATYWVTSESRSLSFFGVGDPNFQGSKDNESIKFSELNTRGPEVSNSVMKLNRLPNTRVELQEISQLNGFEKFTLLLGSEATEKNVTGSEAIKEADIISFATHGITDGETTFGYEPGLAFTVGNPVNQNDNGYMNLSEVLKLDLNAELVILSACSTGSPQSHLAPAFSGLASAFLAAGSEQVLASHWPVESASTAKLIKYIVRERLTNYTSWETARLKGIQNFINDFPEYRSPWYWAPFSIFRNLVVEHAEPQTMNLF